jgi:bidirectional [NiFe] hydrogenase diaphorase subunit
MLSTTSRPAAPSADKRWKLVDVTMRRNGYAAHALIETLHTVQESFGYLDETSMRYVANCLRVPLSKVYGVATFYHVFSLKPQGEHTCVVCTGTACYIKGADQLLQALQERYHVAPGETTTDRQLSVLSARCLGACGLAPAAVINREILGRQTPDTLLAAMEGVVGHAS